MAEKHEREPTERTSHGYEVRVPERQEFFGNLKKAAKPEPVEKDPEPPRGDTLAD
jgi:hypothetical protein